MKRYEQIFDLRNIEILDNSNVMMVDSGIVGDIESAMMDRIGYRVRVTISVCRNQG